MKLIRTSLIATGLTLVLAGTALAQAGPVAGQGMSPSRMEHMREYKTERHARHLGELKAKLKLDPGQEQAWKNFAETMQAPVAPAARPGRAAFEKLTTPERIEQMQALHAQRDAEMKKRASATQALYAQLNAEQKIAFDAETAGHMQQGRGVHRHGPH